MSLSYMLNITNILIIILYVGDSVCIKNNLKMTKDFRIELMKRYEKKNLNLLHPFLRL